MLVVAVWRMEKAVIGNVVTEKERSEVRVLFTVLLYSSVVLYQVPVSVLSIVTPRYRYRTVPGNPFCEKHCVQ